jgi:hypothetical protein
MLAVVQGIPVGRLQRWVVAADDKKRARLNTIRHLLSVIPYEDIITPKIELPPRQTEDGYVRPPIFSQHFVPDEY